jgi:hypothetical protein
MSLGLGLTTSAACRSGAEKIRVAAFVDGWPRFFFVPDFGPSWQRFCRRLFTPLI